VQAEHHTRRRDAPSSRTHPTPRGVVRGAPPSFRNLGQFDATSGRKLTKIYPHVGGTADLGQFDAASGRKLTKVHPHVGGTADLGQFDAASGRKLTKVDPYVGGAVDPGQFDSLPSMSTRASRRPTRFTLSARSGR
jgi:hypothetical protein